MQDLIRQFGVDWKMLAAQAVNFFILLFLLKRFAYTPILAMLNERRRKIEEGLAASEEAKKQLADAELNKKTILLKAEEDAVAVVTHAESIADEQAKKIILSGEEKSQQIVLAGERKLEEERRMLEEEVMAEAHELVRKGLRATIGRMNPTERDEVLIKEALRELSTLS